MKKSVQNSGQPEATEHSYTDDLTSPSDLLRYYRLKFFRSSLPDSSQKTSHSIYREGDAYYDALKSDIQSARSTVDMEVYILENDRVGASVLEQLKEAVARGVRVRLLVDGVGSFGLARYGRRMMDEMGIQFRVYRPLNVLSIFRLSSSHRRSHRKLVVVDNRIAYLGGMNIHESSSYYYRGQDAWRDAMIRLKGEVARDASENFRLLWENLDRPFALARAFRHKKIRTRDIQIIENIPIARRIGHRLLFLSMLQIARKSIYIQTAYFVPRLFLIRALKKMAERGVDVRVVLNEKSDVRLTLWAGRAVYGTLMKSGVKIYERKGRFSHAKLAVVDDRFSLLGSTNLDYRSFMHNLEIDVLSRRSDLSSELTADFFREIENSNSVSYDVWKKRPVRKKILEKLAFAFRYWL